MTNQRFAVIALAAVSSLMVLEPAHAVVIDFNPTSTSVALGESFAVDVVVSGLRDSGSLDEIVSAFDLDVWYDASIISATGFEFSSALGTVDVDAFTSATTSLGRIDFASVSLLDVAALFALQSDAVMLGRLMFDAIGAGNTGVFFDPLTDPGILLVGADPFGSLQLSRVGSALIDVTDSTPVPEPATFGLLLAGLGYAAWARRRIG